MNGWGRRLTLALKISILVQILGFIAEALQNVPPPILNDPDGETIISQDMTVGTRECQSRFQ